MLPDMLSTAPLPETVHLHVHLIASNLPVSKFKLEELREATANDQSLRELKETIKSGWPEMKSQTPASIRVYWDARDELSELDGIILKEIESLFHPL